MTEKPIDSQQILNELEKKAASLPLAERNSIFRGIKSARMRLRNGQPIDRILSKLQVSVLKAEENSLGKITESLKYSFPESLPISARAEDIRKLMADNQVVIVCGTTGSGKTTQLPKVALALGQGRAGRIGCTQPRRLAATAMARRVASELKVKCGHEVGYKVRFDDHTGERTVVKFMTDGILLAETQNDPNLLQYDTLIIDEAHERSLNIDFILGYIKNLISKRKDLKIVISSATLDAENFSSFFDNAPVITVEGRTFPVDDFFLPPEEDEELSAHIARAVNWISEVDKEGDILIFLPGEREIRDAADMLTGRNLPRTEILPLFGRLSMSEQQRVFSPGGSRRIILATNVAETSVTIPGIHYVIDSGQVRLSRYNPRTQIQELQIEQVSQASAKQRRGRCGRIAEGICVYLYTEETFAKSQEFTDPEIRRTSLAGVILQMAMLKLPRIDRFPFIDPPQQALIREGYRGLRDIGAIDDHGRITQHGRKIASLPLDPHLAKMVCCGSHLRVLPELIVIVAFLSMQDPRERPSEQKQAADQAHAQWKHDESDFFSILRLWNFIQQERLAGASNSAIRRLCHKNFLNYRRIREWFNLTQDISKSVSDIGMKKVNIMNESFDEPHYSQIHKALLSGIPANIGLYDKEEQIYIGTRNRKFFIFPGSGLFRKKPAPKWVMTFALVNTTRVFARQVAEIEPEWLEQVAPHLCKAVYDNIRWDANKGFVFARERMTSGGLLVHAGRSVHYGKVRPKEAREIFIREAMVPGNLRSSGKWLKQHIRTVNTVIRLEEKLRRPDSIWHPQAVYEHFDRLLPEYVCSSKSLDRWLKESQTQINISLEDAMLEQMTPIRPEDYPDKIEFAGHAFRLQYCFEPGETNDGICIFAPSEEMNLIPQWGLDWLVPGRLAEKIEFMIKSLPKDIRRYCNPASQNAQNFADTAKAGKIFREQPLVDALSEYLTELSGINVKPADFDCKRLPEYLHMKIAELNDKGRVTAYHYEVPANLSSGSMLSSAVGGVGQWISSGCTEWPDGEIPESIELSGDDTRKGFPALTDEGDSVGRQVFLDQREAEYSHNAGLVRLFRLAFSAQVKYLKRSFKLSRNLQMTLFLNDCDKRFEEDFVSSVILTALTDNGRFEVRSSAEFEERAEIARGEMAAIADKRSTLLEQMVELYDKIKSTLRKAENIAVQECEDAENQLAFLFKPGFLCRDIVWARYPRYLRALNIRAERINSAPLKDHEKMQPVIPFIERFELALHTVEDFEKSFYLYEFWLLLEEFRIAQFAPEVRPLEKVSAQKLQKVWDEVRL